MEERTTGEKSVWKIHLSPDTTSLGSSIKSTTDKATPKTTPITIMMLMKRFFFPSLIFSSASSSSKSVNPDSGYFLLVFVGIVTGVGGGLLRDICAGVTPYIFIKHFYACASLLGSMLCAFLWNYTSENIAMISGSAAVLVLRILAAKFRWSLPKAKL